MPGQQFFIQGAARKYDISTLIGILTNLSIYPQNKLDIRSMKNSLVVISAILIPAFAHSAYADSVHVVPFSRTENVSGTAVVFNGSIRYTIPDDRCAAIPIRIQVDLEDLNSKLPPIVRSTGVEKRNKCGEIVAIRGARLWARDGNIGAKVEGKVGRENCIKVMGRVVGTSTIDSNASIETTFDPIVEANRLKVAMIGEPRLRVSNDILRGLLRIFDMDEKVSKKLGEAIQAAIREPNAALALPDQLAGFAFSFDVASAEMVDDRLNLVVEGSSPRQQPLIGAFLGTLGLPPPAPCP